MMKKILFTIAVGGLVLVMSPEVFAGNIQIPFGQETVEHLPRVGLTDQGTGEGIQGIREIVNVVLGSSRLFLRTIAIFVLFVAGFILVSAQSSISDQVQKQKMNVVYTMVGLVVFGLATDFVYGFLFRDQGSYIFTSEEAQIVGSELALRIKDILNLFLSFSGAGAILMLVIAGSRTLLMPGSDEEMAAQKKIVGYTVMGIIIIGLADVLINQIVFPNAGYEGVNVAALEVQLQGLSNYLLGFLGAIVFVTFTISGVVMVANFGNDEVVGKAKSAMTNVLIGVLVVFSAYTIVATLLRTFLAA
ncbi:MAG: hypothetical protein AB7J40_03370 [Candidatus Altimarinota bacterium]